MPTDCLSWVHFGDLHVDEADGFEGLERFRALVQQAQANLTGTVDFAFLPGDNANHGTPDQYARIAEVMRSLDLPWHVIAGDHDFEPGDLSAMAAIAPRDAPYARTIAGYRCLFLDIVSAGEGGPDFRIDRAQRDWIETELSAARVADVRPVVFMHAYPGDLHDDPDGIAALFAAHHVVFVDTGHTHYNELLNDGRVIYGATRSTGQAEEGPPGFSIVTIDDGVPSWRFHAIDADWPLVQITHPADRRLVTDPESASQVPQGDAVVRATVYGGGDGVTARLGDDASVAMTAIGGDRYEARFDAVEDGLHTLTVTAGGAHDTLEILVRGTDATPKRQPPVALGRDVNAIGAWPDHDIVGAQLGPNKNGADW